MLRVELTCTAYVYLAQAFRIYSSFISILEPDSLKYHYSKITVRNLLESELRVASAIPRSMSRSARDSGTLQAPKLETSICLNMTV